LYTCNCTGLGYRKLIWIRLIFGEKDELFLPKELLKILETEYYRQLDIFVGHMAKLGFYFTFVAEHCSKFG
jgi:hypothetical protein